MTRAIWRGVVLGVALAVAAPGGGLQGQPYYGQPYYAPYGQPYYQPPYYQQPYSAPPRPASPAQGDIAGEMLAAHNRVRRALGLPDLQWSPRVAASAARWAAQLRGEGCRMRHSGSEQYGENLAWMGGGHMSPGQVVQFWVDEARYYDRATNRCAPGQMCGHYTQVVWRSTRLLGCAVAYCPDSEVWVCQYDPPGNYVGHRPF